MVVTLWNTSISVWCTHTHGPTYQPTEHHASTLVRSPRAQKNKIKEKNFILSICRISISLLRGFLRVCVYIKVVKKNWSHLWVEKNRFDVDIFIFDVLRSLGFSAKHIVIKGWAGFIKRHLIKRPRPDLHTGCTKILITLYNVKKL